MKIYKEVFNALESFGNGFHAAIVRLLFTDKLVSHVLGGVNDAVYTASLHIPPIEGHSPRQTLKIKSFCLSVRQDQVARSWSL